MSIKENLKEYIPVQVIFFAVIGLVIGLLIGGCNFGFRGAVSRGLILAIIGGVVGLVVGLVMGLKDYYSRKKGEAEEKEVLKEVAGKWATGDNGHIIYELRNDCKFSTYSTTGGDRLTGIYSARRDSLTFFTSTSTGVITKKNRYKVSRHNLTLYPEDGRSSIILERVGWL